MSSSAVLTCVSRTCGPVRKASPPKLGARVAVADCMPNRYAVVIMLCDGVLSALIVNILIILHDGRYFNRFFYCFDKINFLYTISVQKEKELV